MVDELGLVGAVDGLGHRAIGGSVPLHGEATIGLPVTLDLAECRRAVDRRLGELVEMDQPFRSLFVHVFTNPGKRVRAGLVLATANILSTDRPFNFNRDALDLACAVEMLHEASLIHDDICDGSTLRRGVASAPARFGIQFSARAGFYLAGAALHQIASVLERRADFRERLAAAPQDCVLLHNLWQLSLGQILENLPPVNPSFLPHHYRVVVKAKTGTLFRFACSYGAILAGCDSSELKRMMDYADHLAVSFQIMDDIRDLEGTPTLGKETGTDLARHIPTWPLIEWLSGAAEARRTWEEAHSRPLSPDGVQTLCRSIVESGATERAHLAASSEAQQAQEALACFGDNSGKALLGELCSSVLQRQ